jgi:hypothetical protein
MMWGRGCRRGREEREGGEGEGEGEGEGWRIYSDIMGILEFRHHIETLIYD